ncbi:hypothetical protein SDC9_89123 [bioreactor metagenome]|uniref:Uncharacterized protein n=1 Tax=bioreactor metagenome TaxID=1076179 RepID=A0A644ZPZ5_9ZZZZ
MDKSNIKVENRDLPVFPIVIFVSNLISFLDLFTNNIYLS